MVYKSITPATDIPESDSDELQFTESVGSYSELNYYASQIESKAYINTTDNSLNEKTVNGKISRGEALYLLMNVIYPDELANVETTGVTFSDCKMQKDALTKQDGTDGDQYLDSYRAQVSYNNEDEYGCKDEIYKALVLANQKGIIGTETRYDEAITKVEAIQFLVDTLENSGSGEKFNYKNGKTIATDAVSSSENTVTETTNTESDSHLTDEELVAVDPDTIINVDDTNTTSEDNSNSTDNSNTSTSNSDDAATRRANYKSKYDQDYNAKYDIYSWLDDDGDGVITDEEAAYLEDALDEMFSSKETSDSTTSSSSSSSSSSTLDIGTPFDDTVPVTQDIDTIDRTGLRTDLVVH
jgi:hypothetical protein